jgi:hypothetical protein
MKRWTVVLVVLVAVILAIMPGCKKKEASQSTNVQLTKEAPENTAAGLVWSYPSGWTKAGPKAMRVVTYIARAAEGDLEGGECAVFFFGPGAGGDVNSNIQRWESQFETKDQGVRTTFQVNGINVTRYTLSGTYLAPSGPMMESQDKKENFRLLGAIVEAPEGLLFFKMTGPAKTIEAATGGFDAMIGSIQKK